MPDGFFYLMMHVSQPKRIVSDIKQHFACTGKVSLRMTSSLHRIAKYGSCHYYPPVGPQ